VHIHLHTQKMVRVSKLNTYKTLAYAVTYLKMISTAQNYVQHSQETVCVIQFQILLLFLLLKKTFLSLHQTPHYSLFPSGHQLQLQLQQNYSNLVPDMQDSTVLCQTVRKHTLFVI